MPCSFGLPGLSLSGDLRRAILASAKCRSFSSVEGLRGRLQSFAGCPLCQQRLQTSALVQSCLRCPSKKHWK
jgi:hypothetical protein